MMHARVTRPSLNTAWIVRRWQMRHCDHVWIVGARNSGDQACRICGTWRWFPILNGKQLATVLPAALAYVACVVLANVLTEHLGLVSIGFGLVVTAGTFAAGATLLARNITQDATGRLLVLALMLLGCALSWWLASPQLAKASAIAFGLSELADMGVFTPLRRRGFVRASAVATASGAIVDTFVFLHLAGFPVTTNSVTGQLAVKVGVCWAVLALIGGGRAVLRESVDRAGA